MIRFLGIMQYSFYLCFFFVFFASCSENSPSNAQKNTALDSADHEPKENGVKSAPTGTTFNEEVHHISGVWVADDGESGDTLFFGDGKYMEKNNNEFIDTLYFSFSKNSCEENATANDDDDALFLLLKNMVSGDLEFCYDVTNLDGNRLTLTYLQNGNILTFKKVK